MRTRCQFVKSTMIAVLLAGMMFANTRSSQARFIDAANGVRPAGMGDAFVSVADDTNAVLFNPAGLASIRKFELGGMYSALYLNANAELYDQQRDSFGYSFLSAVMPFYELGSCGFSWLHFNSVIYKENSLAFSFGRPFQVADSLAVDAGITAKALNWSIIENEFVDAFRDLYPSLEKWGATADAGIMLRWNDTVRIGVAGENLRPVDMGLTETEMVSPIYRLGASYLWKTSMLYLDSVQPCIEVSLRDSTYLPKFGLESWFFTQLLALRLGVNSNEATAGLGYYYRWQKEPLFLQVDYAFSFPFKIQDTLGSHRLGMTVYWDPVLAEIISTSKQKEKKDAEKNADNLKSALTRMEWAEEFSLWASQIHENSRTICTKTAAAINPESNVGVANHFEMLQDLVEIVDAKASSIFAQALSIGHEVVAAVEPIKNADLKTYEKIRSKLSIIQKRNDNYCSPGIAQTKNLVQAENQPESNQAASNLFNDKSLEDAEKLLITLPQQTRDSQPIIDEIKKIIPIMEASATVGQIFAEQWQFTAITGTFSSVKESVGNLSNGVKEFERFNENRIKSYADIAKNVEAAKNYPVNQTKKIIIGCEINTIMDFTSITKADAFIHGILSYLSEKTGLDISLKQYTTSEGLEADFTRGKIDMVLTGRAEQKHFYQQELGIPTVFCQSGGQEYQVECLFVRGDSAITSAEQLKGKKVGCLSPESIFKQKTYFGVDFTELKQYKDVKSAIGALQVQEMDAIAGVEYIYTIFEILQTNGDKPFPKGMKKIANSSHRVLLAPVFQRVLLKQGKLDEIKKLVNILVKASEDPEGKKILKYFKLDQITPGSCEKYEEYME